MTFVPPAELAAASYMQNIAKDAKNDKIAVIRRPQFDCAGVSAGLISFHDEQPAN